MNLGSVLLAKLERNAGGGLLGGGGGVIKLGSGVEVTRGEVKLVLPFDMDELVSDLDGLSSESDGL